MIRGPFVLRVIQVLEHAATASNHISKVLNPPNRKLICAPSSETKSKGLAPLGDGDSNPRHRTREESLPVRRTSTLGLLTSSQVGIPNLQCPRRELLSLPASLGDIEEEEGEENLEVEYAKPRLHRNIYTLANVSIGQGGEEENKEVATTKTSESDDIGGPESGAKEASRGASTLGTPQQPVPAPSIKKSSVAKSFLKFIKRKLFRQKARSRASSDQSSSLSIPAAPSEVAIGGHTRVTFPPDSELCTYGSVEMSEWDQWARMGWRAKDMLSEEELELWEEYRMAKLLFDYDFDPY
ncbi:hypothetical protein FRB90_001507 [Tulasnella sp. 427]|nr:hypothetical protein FRB90_001507 [Tulasnella sp. 427]